MLDPVHHARFVEIVGQRNVLTAPEDMAPFLREWRDLYQGETPMVLRPGTREEVSAILAHADATASRSCPRAETPGSWAARFLAIPSVRSF